MQSDYPPKWKTALLPWRKPQAAPSLFYAREAILEHLDDLEDLYLAEQRLIEIRAGCSKTHIILEEVERSLGLAMRPRRI